MKKIKYYSWLLLLVSALAAAIPGHAQTGAQQTDFTAAELDQMLAPIALYPDTVLSHLLIASTYPLEVVQADRWVRDNPGLEAEAAVAAVEDQDWDPSVKALVAFPQVLERMSDDLAWTQRLGNAFLDDEALVMDAIQNLRNKAYASGSLDRLEHVRVQREKEVIIIEPAVERVVYVPVYDTRVVYGNWWWHDHPPVYWHYPSHVSYVGGFYWGPRIHIGPSFYFSSFHWRKRHVVYVDHRRYNHRPHFYSGRSIANYSGARHWRHNPTHRRGVAYHNERVRQHYGSNRQSYSTVHQQRRDQQQVIGPRAARDQASHLRAGSDVRATRDARLDGNTRDGRPNLQRESDRVQERLSSNREGNTSRYTNSTANPRPGMSNNQQDRTRDARFTSERAERGNSTLPSRATAPSRTTTGGETRPNMSTQGGDRNVLREQRSPNVSNQQQAAQQQAQRLQRAQQQPQRQPENRSALGNTRQEVRPQTNTQSNQAPRQIERTARPEAGRPGMSDGNRAMRSEGNRSMRTEGGRPGRPDGGR